METKHQQAARSLRLHLIDRARRASERAISYRGFKVGCAMLAWRDPKTLPLGQGPYQIFTGANIKATQHDPKLCAEQIALQAAREAGYTLIVAISVSGPPQLDDASQVMAQTLHPCAKCRTMFRQAPEVTGETLVITPHPEQDMYELLTLSTLLDLHWGKLATPLPEPERFEDLAATLYDSDVELARWIAVENRLFFGIHSLRE